MSDFDWAAIKNNIAIPHQAAVAVYENPDGNCVIRAERDWPEDEDPYVVIARGNVPAIIAALQRFLSEAADG